MLSNRLLMYLLFFTLFIMTQHCFAAYETTENISQVVKSFVLKSIPANQDETLNVQVKQLDKFTHLLACTKDIEPALPSNSSPNLITSVELTCTGDNPWHVMIPVDVQIFTKVLVSKRNIPAKEVISADDVDFASYNKTLLYSGYYSNKEEVVGDQAMHLIPAGTVLTDKNLQKPTLVMRNQVTDIVVKKNVMTITMKGVAKMDGRLNEVIKVYNPASKRTIDAVVIGQNKAEAV